MLYEKFAAKLTTGQFRFYAIIAFFIIVFMGGGGSRSDIDSLVFLRPLAILFCAYALSAADSNAIKTVKIPLFILLALMMIIVLQLVPLPPEIWRRLPQREIYGVIADIAGIQPTWRPLNLSPSGGWNSLFSTTIPLAALLLFAIQTRDNKRKVFYFILLAALFSGTIGILQLATHSTDLFYFYKITNEGLPVGLFANRNHQALLFAIAIIIFGWWISNLHPNRNYIKTEFSIIILGVLFSIVIVFIIGSRSGLILSCFAMLALLLFLYNSPALSSAQKQERAIFGYKISRKAIVLTVASVSIAGVSVLVIFMSRSLALDRLLHKVPVETLRSKIFPALTDMTDFFFPYGSGFGSFQRVFYQFETSELLRPQYLNHAHNDWIEFVIEGGVAAALVLAAFIVWFLLRSFQVIIQPAGPEKSHSLTAISIVLICALASITDYPLRVPAIMVIFVFACGILEGREQSNVR